MKTLLRTAFVAAVLAYPIAGQEEQARGRPEVVDVVFSGNDSFPVDTLKRAIVNRATECGTMFLVPFCKLGFDFAADRRYFRADEFARDAVRLRLYYWQHGYREAQVDTASVPLGPEAISLVFTIDEGRPVLVDSIAVLAGEGIATAALLEDLPLRVGQPLSGLVVEATRDTLENRLRDEGFAHALVLLRTDLPRDAYSASVTFDVDPGPRARFGPIEIVGNTELSERVVRRMLDFSEGDLYGTAKILEAQQNLFGLEIVQYANVDTLPTAELDTILPMRVEVSETYEYRVRAGAGWSTADCLTTEARWAARNFLGGARRLQVRGRVANVLSESLHDSMCTDAGVGAYGRLNWLVAVDFTQPWILSPRNSLTLGLYGERTSLPDVFVREAVGVNLALVRSLARNTPLSLSYRPQLSRLSAAEVFFCTSFLACAPSDINVVQGANWLAPVGASISTDRTDNLLDPRSGYRGALDLEHASGRTGSNYAYDRVLAELSGYRGVGGNSVVAFRLRVGWVGGGAFELLPSAGDVVHPLKRFYAGGSNSVRGFAQNRLGPKVLTVSAERLLQTGADTLPPACSFVDVVALACDARTLEQGAFTPQPTGGTRVLESSFEYRFPITPDAFEGVAFVDVGQVWDRDESVDLSALAWTPGAGLRYYSPIGPIRLDLAYRPARTEHLRIVTSQVAPCEVSPRRAQCMPFVLASEQAGPGFVLLSELGLLGPTMRFETESSFQLHFSIGQAF